MDRAQLQKLFQYSFSLTQEKASAEDLLQSSLEKFIKLDKAFDNPTAYIRRIIRNQFIDDCRRLKIISFEVLEEGAPALMEDRSLEDLQIQNDLIEYIFKQLATAEREVLYLWALMGYSATEIAKDTGQSRGTVLSRLHRIKQKVIASVQADEASAGGSAL
ncbi:MAG: RNA polymerase subunit sigma-24 [Moraxellaceae bacterium]|nr:MAG: RNA polymerase subunit sigma-24 [Moraxellaceae bacterium]